MKTLKQLLLPVLESFEFVSHVIRYALIFVCAFFFRQRTSWACETVAIRSQLTFCEENIRQKRLPALGFTRRFASWGVAVKRVGMMEICDRADETQDGAPVA